MTQPIASTGATRASQLATAAAAAADRSPAEVQLREAFDAFVGETFFGQLIASMRRSTGQPAYFYGGRAEQVFQKQLDQQLAQQLAKSAAPAWTEPMFELFNLSRS